MALDSTQVKVAVTGNVYVGPPATAGPTDASTALPAGFKDLGYVNEDGVTESRSRSTNKIKAWQNAAVVREVVTDADFTLKFVLVQTNADTVGLYYGTTVDPTTGGVIIVPSATGGRQSFVLHVIDGVDLIRLYVPSGEITEVGDQKFVNGDPVGYEVTVTAYSGTYGTTLWTGAAKKFYSSLKTS